MLREALAVTATILTTVSYIPQIARAYRTKSLDDVSVWFLLAIALGVLTWVAYALVVRDWIFFTANAIILSLAITLLAMKYAYAQRRMPRRERAGRR